ncbi:hypothetical protein LCGC14_0608850 [marine sediment metagenome]|uniref:acetyl-CoA carboxytransferase n=1 Tax=marine sediment metagenome TaxID=412755 RepID=A0A0F9RD98_9ZZZZ
MNIQYLNFEDSIKTLDLQIQELLTLSSKKGINYNPEIRSLQKRRVSSLQKIYKNLTPWEIIQVARHPQRPILEDYLEHLVIDFKELHGDKCFGDDRALITGLGEIENEKVLILGHNKGKKIDDNITRNFGSPHPEGYRKALQKMKFAEKFRIPIISFIDTPGAYPGLGSEERGVARAISENLLSMSILKVPIICIIIGEGGSGGALGIGVGDKLSMLEFSYYSVISPEGGAAILGKDIKYAEEMAKSLKLTSSELLKLDLVDEVIKEPIGGAQRSHHDIMYSVRKYILRTLRGLKRVKIENLLENRYKKLRNVGK